MYVDPVSIKALQNVLAEMETLLSASLPIPENRTAHCVELLQAARALMKDMVKRASRVQ